MNTQIYKGSTYSQTIDGELRFTVELYHDSEMDMSEFLLAEWHSQTTGDGKVLEDELQGEITFAKSQAEGILHALADKLGYELKKNE